MIDPTRLQGHQYTEPAKRLAGGERFVVSFACPLQPLLLKRSIMTAQVVLSGGDSLPFLSLIKAAGLELAVIPEEINPEDFQAWMAGTFCRQYAGAIEEVDAFEAEAMLRSTDTPDFWLFKDADGLYASLLIFDPFEVKYWVVYTWLSGFNESTPQSVDECVQSIKRTKMKDLLERYRSGGPELRAELLPEILHLLDY